MCKVAQHTSHVMVSHNEFKGYPATKYEWIYNPIGNVKSPWLKA